MYLLKTVESLGDIERVQEWPIKNINFSSLYGVPMSSTDRSLVPSGYRLSKNRL